MINIQDQLEAASRRADILSRVEDSIREIQLQKHEMEIVGRAKDEFLSNMSHEMKTPLNGILGAIQILKTELGDSSKVMELLEVIERSSYSLSLLMDDLLDLSRIQAGSLELEINRLNLRSVVNSAIQIVEPRAEKKNIFIELEYDDRISSTLLGDASRVRQVLINFLSNGVKFTSKGKVSCKVVCLQDLSREQKIAIEVQDTGIGIDKEHLGNIFDSFYQGDSSHTRQYGGTGMGLSISKRLIEAMGGRINVSSQVGAGSKFKVDFILKKWKGKVI